MRHVAIAMTAAAPAAGTDALVGLLAAGSPCSAFPGVVALFREAADLSADADAACSS